MEVTDELDAAFVNEVCCSDIARGLPPFPEPAEERSSHSEFGEEVLRSHDVVRSRVDLNKFLIRELLYVLGSSDP